MLSFIISGNPVTKKNSGQIIINPRTKRPMLIPSKQYSQYLNDCRIFIKKLDKPIDKPINIKAVYYMQTKRRVDLCNLHNALHDILVHYDVIEDDNSNIVVSTDGSRVRYDKQDPRTEVIITEVVE